MAVSPHGDKPTWRLITNQLTTRLALFSKASCFMHSCMTTSRHIHSAEDNVHASMQNPKVETMLCAGNASNKCMRQKFVSHLHRLLQHSVNLVSAVLLKTALSVLKNTYCWWKRTIDFVRQRCVTSAWIRTLAPSSFLVDIQSHVTSACPHSAIYRKCPICRMLIPATVKAILS